MNSQRICEIFDELEEDNPDKSAEWLLTITANRYNIEHDTQIDDLDVATALCDTYGKTEEETNSDEDKYS